MRYAFGIGILICMGGCAGNPAAPTAPANDEIVAAPPLEEPEPAASESASVASEPDAGPPVDAASAKACETGEMTIVRDGKSRVLAHTAHDSIQHGYAQVSFIDDNVVMFLTAAEPTTSGTFGHETLSMSSASRKPDGKDDPNGFKIDNAVRKVKGSIWYRPPESKTELDEFVNLDAPIEITRWGDVGQIVEGSFGPFQDTVSKRKGKFSGTFRVCRVADRHIRDTK